MKARLVRIGNSRGVRLPKPLIEEAGLTEDVELHVQEGKIVISRVSRVREGWSQEAKKLAAREEDHLLDEPTATHFDTEEWNW
jgi:antitoxin MazE